MTPDQWTIYVCADCKTFRKACGCGYKFRGTVAVEVVPAARLAEVEAERDRLREHVVAVEDALRDERYRIARAIDDEANASEPYDEWSRAARGGYYGAAGFARCLPAPDVLAGSSDRRESALAAAVARAEKAEEALREIASLDLTGFQSATAAHVAIAPSVERARAVLASVPTPEGPDKEEPT